MFSFAFLYHQSLPLSGSYFRCTLGSENRGVLLNPEYFQLNLECFDLCVEGLNLLSRHISFTPKFCNPPISALRELSGKDYTATLFSEEQPDGKGKSYT